MSIFRKKQKRSSAGTYLCNGSGWEEILCSGYTSLSKNPEIMAGVNKIADLISSMTIHLMGNTANGDVRIRNELSKKIDIYPNPFMTRKTFISVIIRTLMLEGRGNAVVMPKTKDGLLDSLNPIEPSKITYQKRVDAFGYDIQINGKKYNPESLIHFVINPEPENPYVGTGYQTTLQDIADNLKQAQATKKGFMESKWKPSMVIKVDGMVEEFSSQEGRDAILQSYLDCNEAGKPWLIPAEQFDIKEIRPLSLNDIAITDSVKLDKCTVASILGVPAFVLGEGSYNADEWNNFINTRIRPLCKMMEQELTRKLLLNPKWYFRFSSNSLLSYDIETLSKVGNANFKSGILTGNEVREMLGYSPKEGLDKLIMLENYIPLDKIGDQKKLEG